MGWKGDGERKKGDFFSFGGKKGGGVRKTSEVNVYIMF